MYTYLVYEVYCRECGDISLLLAEDKGAHIQAAKSHHESTGHTCEVYEETKSTGFLRGRIPKIASHYDAK